MCCKNDTLLHPHHNAFKTNYFSAETVSSDFLSPLPYDTFQKKCLRVGLALPDGEGVRTPQKDAAVYSAVPGRWYPPV